MSNKPCGCRWETTGNLRVQHLCTRHTAQSRWPKYEAPARWYIQRGEPFALAYWERTVA